MGILFLRTIILYLAMTFAMRLMGKRQVGELQPLELTVTIIISNIASLPLEHSSFPFFNGLIPVLTLVALEVTASVAALRWRGLRRLTSGRPVVVILEGVIQQTALRTLRFSVDDLLEELRLAGIFDPADVQTAVVETSGKLSVCRRASAEPLTPGSLAELDVRVGNANAEFQLSVSETSNGSLRQPQPLRRPPAPSPPFVAVSDGTLESENLALNHASAQVVQKILEQESVSLAETLLLTLNRQGQYYLVRKETKKT